MREIDFNKIELLILDNDGVLTDGKIIYNNHKIESKAFSAKDGLGINMLSFSSIQVAIITGRESEILVQRCKDLGIRHLYQKVRNKLQKTEKLLNELNFEWQNVAYLGDDWNDYPVIKKAAFTACPADAFSDFKAVTDYTCERKGGEGAVREVIEFLLKKQGKFEYALQKLLEHLEEK
ncbi:MAG: HAD hydrolase family protein [Candidatus Cloacimonetes bacterium]|nr:HAD hydrolase family protein [Candidatus Cloacimonadota bacterium]